MAIFTLALVVGICTRSVLLSRPPISTLYETIPFITAVAVILCLLIEFFDRKGIALASSVVVVGIIGIFLAWRFEIKESRDTLKVLEAVLRSNFWLATHVIAINIGYAAAILAGLIAHIFIFSKALKLGSEDFRKSITRMVYGVTCFGLLFALVGTVLGGVWANDSWEGFGWDPKENGALMICLGALIMLHARMGGYIKDLGMNVIGFLILVITVLFLGGMLTNSETGLHSYGFTSGIMRWLYIVYAIECAVITVGLSCYRSSKKGFFHVPAAVSFFLLAFIFTVAFVTMAFTTTS